jgi:4-carboxymuconolactone decarboxylase
VGTTHASRITDELVLPDPAPEGLDQIGEVTGGAVNVGLTILHHPALATRYQPFGLSFLTDGILPARERELVILRTSWRCCSPYEWAHHTRIGQACGISVEELRRIAVGDLREWPSDDADLLDSVDAVVRDHSLSEAQWTNLTGRYGTAGAIEMVMLAGHYVMLAGVLNSAATRIEPGIEAAVPMG